MGPSHRSWHCSVQEAAKMLHDVVANFTHARLKVVGEGWLDPWATSENE